MEYNPEIIREMTRRKRLESNPEKVNCFLCVHFQITWEEEQPRACDFFGFKGKELPSVIVKKTTGVTCPAYEEKQS